eukprot:SAG31_NODE_15170_length_767_cov_0.922156_1_plen_75_part_10
MVELVVDKIDPMVYTPAGIKKSLHHILYQDSAQYRFGTWIKNLNFLNRDLDKVIMLDHNGDAEWQINPENIITLS